MCCRFSSNTNKLLFNPNDKIIIDRVTWLNSSMINAQLISLSGYNVSMPIIICC